jgi:hypothetical protein
MPRQHERFALFQQKRDVTGKGNAILHRDQRTESMGVDETQDFGLVVLFKVFG